MSHSHISSISIYPLAIPMRQRVEHAASQRRMARPIVVAIELRDGTRGWGETLPRLYVTGEDEATVLRQLEQTYMPHLLELAPQSFAESLELIEQLPDRDQAMQCINASRAAIELALLDAYSRYFLRPLMDDLLNWLELTTFRAPGSINQVRCSGVLAHQDVSSVLSSLRKMWWYGLRDFKLKVGHDQDDVVVQSVARRLSAAIKKRRATLRLDVNGVWSLSQALQKIMKWRKLGISYIEQPFAKGDEENNQDLKAHTHWKLIHDESCLTLSDAQALHRMNVADAINIRISKCGGLINSLKLARYCGEMGIKVILGCMVGQTSILSAVERRFLSVVPAVAFAESNYGTFLMRRDITRPQLRFTYGGRLKPLKSSVGWGVEVDPAAVQSLCDIDPVRLHL